MISFGERYTPASPKEIRLKKGNSVPTPPADQTHEELSHAICRERGHLTQ